MAAGDQFRHSAQGSRTVTAQWRNSLANFKSQIDHLRQQADQMHQLAANLEAEISRIESQANQLEQLAAHADQAERNMPR